MNIPKRTWSYLILIVIIALCVGTSPAFAQFPVRASGCAWQPGFHISGPAVQPPPVGVGFYPELIFDAAVFDDGGGAALYVGGGFRTADGLTTVGIARWDGLAWTALPSTGAASEAFFSMAAIASGPLAGIYMSSSQGVLRRWDGTAWSAISPPPGVGSFSGSSLAGGDAGLGQRLFFGGASGIFQWNGSAWSQLGGDTNGAVRSLAIWNDGGGNKLYAAGGFTQIGAVGAARVARWNGTAWSPLGSGVAGGSAPEAKTLIGIGSRLYVGGSFTTADGSAAANLASWNGSAWSALAGGADGPVEKLAAFADGSGTILAASGDFDNLGSTARLAVWNGSAWSALGIGEIPAAYRTLIQFDEGDGNALFVGGQFPKIGGASTGNLRRWHDGDWSVVTASPGHGLDGGVNQVAVHDDGSGDALYVSGQTRVPGPGASYSRWLIKWDGTAWANVPAPSGEVTALLSHDDGSGSALYAGISFLNVIVVVPSVKKWDGAAWTSVGQAAHVTTMAEYDDGTGTALYAAGSEASFPTDFDSSIAKWDGASWSPLGVGIFGEIDDLAVYDDGGGPELYAVGEFTEIGDSSPIPAAHIAKWDGTTWTPVGSGFDDRAVAMAVWNDGGGNALYVVGQFTTAGGAPAAGIAKWNGTAWSAVGGGASAISEIVVFDDGAGSALYVNGPFTTIGGQPIANGARWDGSAWTPIGTGGTPRGKMAVYDPGSGDALFFGGSFTQAGGFPSYSIAQYCRPGMFQDGFESGDTDGWNQVFP